MTDREDDLKIGGTPDRIVEMDGEKYIADIKTGSIDFGVDGLQPLARMHAQRTAARAQATLKRPDLYGKTGTTNDAVDAWPPVIGNISPILTVSWA